MKPRSRFFQGGFALILVLAFLALITIVVLAFLLGVTTDFTSTKTYASGATTKEMADSVVQLVMGQIRQATTQGTAVAWASQPGMIRTYDNTGKGINFYKLYSSGQMVTAWNDASGFQATVDASKIGSDLDSTAVVDPAQFTDLNSPVTDSEGAVNYPIVDPSAATSPVGGGSYLATGAMPVQGFSVVSPGAAEPNGCTAPPAINNNTLSMPVRWLYVFQDGTLSPGIPGGTSGTVTFDQSTKPLGTAADPVVGRVAFWTDDETGKVNINTAGEGVYWDNPKAGGGLQNAPIGNLNGATVTFSMPPPGATSGQTDSVLTQDSCYSAFQPMPHEYQRYPGHPAGVALSPIFQWLMPNSPTPGPPNSNIAYENAQVTASSIVSSLTSGFIPRLAWGGSQGGTVPYTSTGLITATPHRYALFSSIDELMFQDNGTRTMTNANITKPQLEAAKFFLTANSNVPEVNLFNQPRVSIWPIHELLSANLNNLNYGDAEDKLLAFCSSLQTSPSTGLSNNFYYFQRHYSQDCSYDGTIPRNIALYSYLQNLTSTPFPGFGGTFNGKYTTSERDQILTEIMDYIRCTDLLNNNLVHPFTEARTTYFGALGSVAPLHFTAPNTGTDTQGFGRSSTVARINFHFICTGDGTYGPSDATYGQRNSPTTGSPLTYAQKLWNSNIVASNPTLHGVQLVPNPSTASPQAGATVPVRCQLLVEVELTNVDASPVGYDPDMLVQISGLNNIQLSGPGYVAPVEGALFPAASLVSPTNVAKDGVSYTSGINWSGDQSSFNLEAGRQYAVPPNYPTPVVGSGVTYPFVSNAFTITKDSFIKLATSATLTINLYQGLHSNPPGFPIDSGEAAATYSSVGATDYSSVLAHGTNNLIQTLTATFPPGQFQVPRYPYSSPNLLAGYSGRFQGGINSSWDLNDVYRDLHVTHADYRLLMGSHAVPANDMNGNPLFAPLINPNGSLSDYYDNSTYNDPPCGPPSTAPTAPTLLLSGYTMLRDYSVGAINNGTSLAEFPFLKIFQSGGSGPQIIANAITEYGPTGSRSPDASPELNDGTSFTIYNPSNTGDFDQTIGSYGPDGAFFNRADDGDYPGAGTNTPPYFNYFHSYDSTGVFHSPNRIVDSPGLFGSLSTGVKRGLPWTTLLFRPQPTHPNAAVPTTAVAYNNYSSPPDHLWMDLFWMPVVEPYAISTPMSTSGKINLNYQVMPFTYIDRSTPLLCAMKDEKMLAIPNGDVGIYKSTFQHSYRFDIINPTLRNEETQGSLRNIAARFNQGDIFRSASEICDVNLVPAVDESGNLLQWTSDATATGAAGFWAAHEPTGDNSRERPYADLYARLTTKSNTFTVHMRVQSLKQTPASLASGQWIEGRDALLSEYRGSSLIERYLDPNNPNLPDFTADTSADIGTYYQFRVISTKKFAP